MHKKFWGLALSLFVLMADQLTKAWIVQTIHGPSDYIHLTSFFSIIFTENAGVSFGLLGGTLPPLALVLIACAVIAYLGHTFYQSKQWSIVLALGAILGGGIGNIIDRLRIGKVVDFLHFYWGQYSFPAFNVADIAVTCGAIFFLYHILFQSKK